jgi:uncharacterized protein (TIGR00106 family)
MLAEFSVEPIGEGAHLGETIAGIVEAVRESGIEHQVTAMGTLLEGDAGKIWDLLRQCHDRAKQGCERVMMHVHIDDRGDTRGTMHRNVERIEELLHKPIPKTPDANL